MPEVIIANLQDKIEIDKSVYSLLNNVIEYTLSLEKIPFGTEVSVAFVDNDYIRELNNTYRSVDSSTDVLSFALEEEREADLFGGPFPGERPLGDIVISLEQAKKQAEEYGHPFVREICFLVVHGVLHLLGYDHETNEDETIMRSKEKSVLRAFDLKRE